MVTSQNREIVGETASFSLGEKARFFSDFLQAGNQVMIKVISLIMLYAPIGLGAYFAYLTGVFGFSLFWKKISLPSVIALGTGSSIATIPSK